MKRGKALSSLKRKVDAKPMITEKINSEKIKKSLPVLILAALGLVLIIIGGSFGKTKKQDADTYTDVGYYTSYLEKRIKDLCESVDGINEAEVLLTLDTSTEYIYDPDATEDFIIFTGSDNESRVKMCEIYPKIRGVAVVCSNGDIPRIRETVVKLLSASLGIPSSRIEVAGSS